MALSHIAECVKIFFSLAPTTEDRTLFEQLRKHLGVMRLQGRINLWYDSEISPGSNAREIIRSHISTADIIVLLISGDFFASDRCVEMEMPYALEQYTTRATPVIPVLLRPIDWSGLPLEQHSPLPPDGRPVSIWENLDAALKEVAEGIRRVVTDLAHRWSNTPRPARPPQFPLSTLPLRHNPFFTDRDTIFTTLHASFNAEQSNRANIQALYGLGGIGKTLLAIEYAHRYQAEYQATLWLNAASRDLLHSDLRSLADQLGISLPKDAHESAHLAAIRNWLQSHDRWLLVLDDLDDFSLLSQLVPFNSSGHVLLTTHSAATGPFAHAISVDQLTIEEGALLLLRRAKRIAEQGTREDASAEDYTQAMMIAQEFASYPLALDQAGAYIDETGRSLASYLDLYRQRKAAFLGTRGRFVEDHPNPVTTTLALTFEKIAQVDPAALQLLHLFAFLYPEALPDEMIAHGASSLVGPLRTLLLDPLALDAAIATLRRFSLLQRGADSTTLNMHHIVQITLRQELTQQQQVQMAKQAVRLVNTIFPEVRFETWGVCERYVPQAQHCATLLQDFQLSLPEGAQLLERLGFYYYQRGYYGEAEAVLTQSLHLHERQRRPDLLDMAQTLNSLGLLAQRQSRYQEAEAFHQRALKLREQELGTDDLTTAESLHNLAVLYESQGQYQQAEQFYLRVLAIDEREVGTDHPDTAKTLNNLGLVHYLQGHYEQAETLYRRALAIYEQASYADHPDITYTLNSLGTLYETQGDYRQAEALYRQALAMRKQAFGEMHSETAHNINKLAYIIELQGDYQQAEVLYRQALTIGEQVLGAEHPDVALFLNNLALLTARQEQYQQAEALYRRALSIYEQSLEPEHPAVARVRSNLEQLHRKMEHEEQGGADSADI